jgi:hypothetical protein
MLGKLMYSGVIVFLTMTIVVTNIDLLHADEGAFNTCTHTSAVGSKCCKCSFYFDPNGDEGFTCSKKKHNTSSSKCANGPIGEGFCDTSEPCTYNSGGDV